MQQRTPDEDLRRGSKESGEDGSGMKTGELTKRRTEQKRSGSKVAEEMKRCYESIRMAEDYGCFISVRPEQESAALAELRAEKLFGGLPIAVKDNLCTKDLRTTCGSRVLEQYVPMYDATAVQRLEEAGAVVIGKTNMDEFAMGSTTEHSAFGITKNPAAPNRIPGGSSGGSAAAVALGLVPCAIGTDTGGSVRQPAAMCGIVGFKPSYGLISRYGLIAYASSFDTVGTLTTTVEDAAALLTVMAGEDGYDLTLRRGEREDYLAKLRAADTTSLKGVRIGVPVDGFSQVAERDVWKKMNEATDVFRALGAEILQVSLPDEEQSVATYYIMATAQAASNLGRYDGVRYGERMPAGTPEEMYTATRTALFGLEAKRRMLLGNYVLQSGYYDAYYRKALAVRESLRAEYAKLYRSCDVLLTPTSPRVAWAFGESKKNPLMTYRTDCYTVAANLIGAPAISMPCGKDADGLPIGLQLMGEPFGEDILFRVAAAYETAEGRDA